MPLQKNQVLTLRVERLSSDGSGVAHSPDGETVFIPGAAPGDEARVRIVKDCKRYAFGILDEVLTPSPDRIPVDCAVAGPWLQPAASGLCCRAARQAGECCRCLCPHRRIGCACAAHCGFAGSEPLPQ